MTTTNHACLPRSRQRMTSLGTEGHYDNASNEEDNIQGGCRRYQHRQSQAELSLSKLQVLRPPPGDEHDTGAHHCNPHRPPKAKCHGRILNDDAARCTSTPSPWRPETPRARTLTLPRVEHAAGTRHSPHDGLVPPPHRGPGPHHVEETET
jgi:hypothetical protein